MILILGSRFTITNISNTLSLLVSNYPSRLGYRT
jgi:hypothetical protein